MPYNGNRLHTKQPPCYSLMVNCLQNMERHRLEQPREMRYQKILSEPFDFMGCAKSATCMWSLAVSRLRQARLGDSPKDAFQRLPYGKYLAWLGSRQSSRLVYLTEQC
ncbi:hypothetical protein LIER_38901 [Lithospermum erythrorhizon]|uniref:Uncharacterized protein n=1 Tax=Lithospermum erythrorhizon TaxID=34254 RepID=A0AAV3Q870_LITER